MDKLIKNLAIRFPELTEEDILISVETIIRAMSSRLVNGGRIELRGFGSFNLNTAVAGNDKNTEIVQNAYIAEPPRIIFKPGQIIRQRVNKMQCAE